MSPTVFVLPDAGREMTMELPDPVDLELEESTEVKPDENDGFRESDHA